MSKGMLSMITIIVALCSKAPYTFLDEPVAGLDGDCTAGGGILGGQNGQKGSFTRAVTADEAINAAFLQLQGYVMEYLFAAVGLYDFLAEIHLSTN